MIFENRHHAGLLLSEKLSALPVRADIVIGLARGGVAVASVIASKLHMPLDVLVVKKITSHMDPELAIGALAPDNVTSVDWQMTKHLGISEDSVRKTLIPNIQLLISKRMQRYLRGRKTLTVEGKTIILVDDGAATGATMKAAVEWMKKKKAGVIVVALPVAPLELAGELKHGTDEIVVLDTPGEFHAVGQFFQDFPQITDEEVVELLKRQDDNKINRL